MNQRFTAWQPILDALTCKVKESDLFGRIEQFTNEEDLVRSLAVAPYTEELSHWIEVTLNDIEWEKCSIRAASFRMGGNDAFCSGDYERSISEYSQSIKYAPERSEELSLAFANRSAAFFHLQSYEDALKDISRAFDNCYPRNLHYKLYQRKGDCLVKLGRTAEAIDVYESAIELLYNIPLDKRSRPLKNIETSISIARVKMGRPAPSVNDNSDIVPLPSPAHGFNEDFPSASQAIHLKESKEKGRFVVAQCDIEVGDILFVEKPFCFVLLPHSYRDKCHNCCLSLVTSVPCGKCCIPLFCCEECRDSAWERYHKWECRGGLNVAHAVGIAHLGLRTTLVAGSLEEHRAFRNGDIDREDSYSAVYGLLTHLADMSVEDRIAYTLTAVCLMLYLMKHTNYFKPYTENEALEHCSDDHMFVGAVILRHICQLVCNGHAIIDVSPNIGGGRIEEVTQVRLATAIYPSASMMNHSCDPNIVNSFYGVHIIVKASKNIPNGQEVFNCYGPHYRNMPYGERQNALKYQYCFTCTCEKCSSPSEFSFKDRFRALRCPNCHGALVKSENSVCLDCHKHPELLAVERLSNLADEAHRLYENGCVLFQRSLTDDAYEVFQECYDVQIQCLYAFHEEHRLCLNKISQCCCLKGDFPNGIFYFRRSLRAVAQQFGSLSIEMGFELHTLTDLMITDLEMKCGLADVKDDCEIALEHVYQMKRIFELFYGPWTCALRDSIRKENQIKQIMRKYVPPPHTPS